MACSDLELWWLRTRGGRTEMDVLIDEVGAKFVYMGDGNGGLERVYIPSEETIRELMVKR